MEVENIVIKYSDTVYKIAYSMTRSRSDADDIFQDVFMKYFEKNIEFENEEYEKAWLIRVTINMCKMLYRKKSIRKEEELDENMNISTNNDDKSVLEYVRKLPIKYHSVIYLHYYEGYQVNEIAKMLKTTSGTIKSRLSRARKLLQKNMEGEFNYE